MGLSSSYHWSFRDVFEEQRILRALLAGLDLHNRRHLLALLLNRFDFVRLHGGTKLQS